MRWPTAQPRPHTWHGCRWDVCRYGLAKRLVEKSLHHFQNSDLMLRLVEADKERLATLKLHSPRLDEIIRQFVEVYSSSELGDTVLLLALQAARRHH